MDGTCYKLLLQPLDESVVRHAEGEITGSNIANEVEWDVSHMTALRQPKVTARGNLAVHHR